MDDLIVWLRVQLDDDERVARQMMAEPCGFYIEAETADTNIMTVGAHVYRWTPKRVVDEVDAKRRMIDWLDRADDRATSCDYFGVNPEEAVKLIAMPYADREGYRDEWRP